MFRKPSDYDSAPSYSSDSIRIPAGGYLCQILKMEESTTRDGKTPIVKVFYDVCEGAFSGYFSRLYKLNKQNPNGKEVKWKGVYTVFPQTKEGATNGAWKGLLENIEQSNGYKINWSADYDQFKGKKIGLLLREEEFESNIDGTIITVVRAFASRKYDTIRDGEFEMPQKKTAKASNTNTAASTEFEKVEVDDDELPF